MRRFPLMVFAAGFGTRMGALTADLPKPLIPLAGRPLIDHALALADPALVGPVVVNLHYRGAQIAEHLVGRDLHLSWERETILDTGGGMKQALHLLKGGPVMALNADAAWTGPNPLVTLAGAWRDGMKGLLLVAPRQAVTGREGLPADFLMDAEGRLTRARGATEGVVFLGAQILAREPIAAWPERVFSLNRIWDALIAEGALQGVMHHGGWCDVGTPEGLAQAERMLAEDAHG